MHVKYLEGGDNMRPRIFEDIYTNHLVGKVNRDGKNPKEPDGKPMAEGKFLELARGYAVAATCIDLLYPPEKREDFEWFNSKEAEEYSRMRAIIPSIVEEIDEFIQENGKKDSSREGVTSLIKAAIEYAQEQNNNKNKAERN